MRLVNIKIQNYRLLINADLKVDDNSTLIVGRNNTAKTSCVELIDKVLKNNVLSYDDYPLIKRKYAYVLLAQFMRKAAILLAGFPKLNSTLRLAIHEPLYQRLVMNYNLEGLSKG